MRSAHARLVGLLDCPESCSRSHHILSFYSQCQRRAHGVFGWVPFYPACSTAEGTRSAGTPHLFAFLVHMQMVELRAGCSALSSDNLPWELGKAWY
jgi:hypothetical protein